jgi:hypothetical protein
VDHVDEPAVAREVSFRVAQGISQRTLEVALATCCRQVREGELLEAFEEQQHGAVERAYWRLSPAAMRCEAWLIRWPAGSVAPLHDHGRAHGVARVLAGTLHELRFVPGAARPQAGTWHPGESIVIARGLCHEVRNTSERTAYSVHVYAPRLERMTFYDRGACGELRPVRQERSTQWRSAG